MLQISNLYKKYNTVLALAGLQMEIQKGQLYGFVGPNGAGKTTTIRIISGLLKPTRGEVWIDGIRVEKNLKVLKDKIGYIPDFFGVYDNLTVMEYLEFYASAYGIYGKESTVRARQVLEQVELERIEDHFVDELSRGMQQRLCLARALIHKPQLLVMDEPASGMDPGARRVLKNVLRNLCRDGYTVLISSHILSELADMCSNVGIINQGKMILQGDMDEIMCSIDSANPILITIYSELEKALQLLKRHPLVDRISIDRNRISILFSGSKEEEALLMREMIEQGILISSFTREHNSLESVFFHLVDSETGGKNEN
ncbi:MAG: ABC transporter ATP-binding protein [Oliverpabstia sp.]